MRRAWARVTLLSSAAALLGVPDLAFAQVPQRLRSELRARARDLEGTVVLYRPLLAASPRSGVAVVRDLAYGPHRRHRLDIYRGPDRRRAPVVVFVHGGGYVGGERDIDEFAYGNVLTYFARNGLLAVSATYRFAPEDPWPWGGGHAHAGELARASHGPLRG